MEIEVTHNWFGGSLTSTEKSVQYKAQAVENAEVYQFPGLHKQSKKTKDPAIRLAGPIRVICTLVQQELQKMITGNVRHHAAPNSGSP